MSQRKKVFEFCFWIVALIVILYFSIFKPPDRLEIKEPVKIELPDMYNVQ